MVGSEFDWGEKSKREVDECRWNGNGGVEKVYGAAFKGIKKKHFDCLWETSILEREEERG